MPDYIVCGPGDRETGRLGTKGLKTKRQKNERLTLTPACRPAPLPLPLRAPRASNSPRKWHLLGHRILRWRQPTSPDSAGSTKGIMRGKKSLLENRSPIKLWGKAYYFSNLYPDLCLRKRVSLIASFIPQAASTVPYSHSLVENSCQHGPQIIVTMRALSPLSHLCIWNFLLFLFLLFFAYFFVFWACGAFDIQVALR